MAELCPNCAHTSGYWRRSSEDWRCRRCGYIWSSGSGDAPEEEPAPSGLAQARPTLATADVSGEELDRILAERAAELSEEVLEEGEADIRLLMLFSLGEEWYAVDVSAVREIKRQFEITPVPATPSYISGVINLRGEIISATDLAALLGVEDDSENPVIMICDLPDLTTGLVVGGVADIVEVPQNAIEPPLVTLERTKAEYTVGQVAVGDKLVTILDLSRVLTPVGT